MTSQGERSTDEHGTDRVSVCSDALPLSVRLAQEDDCRLLWDWTNEPEVRAASFSSAAIPWADHVQWFQAKMADDHCILYIAQDPKGAPMGQIRYDIEGSEATISISLDRKFRGRGLASMVLCSASRRLFGDANIQTVHAYIKPSNTTSIRAFERAGFTSLSEEVMTNQGAFHLVLKRGMEID